MWWPVLRVHFTQIEGDLIRRGIDPLSDLSLRQIISVTESWFLSFFEPTQWDKVRETLAEVGQTEVIQNEQGINIPVSKGAMADMAELLAAAGSAPEAPSEDSP